MFVQIPLYVLYKLLSRRPGHFSHFKLDITEKTDKFISHNYNRDLLLFCDFESGTNFAYKSNFTSRNLAGQEGLEPPTRGFGDRRSTN